MKNIGERHLHTYDFSWPNIRFRFFYAIDSHGLKKKTLLGGNLDWTRTVCFPFMKTHHTSQIISGLNVYYLTNAHQG